MAVPPPSLDLAVSSGVTDASPINANIGDINQDFGGNFFKRDTSSDVFTDPMRWLPLGLAAAALIMVLVSRK